MRKNVKEKANRLTELTHEGGIAYSVSNLQQLRRSLLSCFLWENEFYEDGEQIAKRIKDTAEKVDPKKVAALAIEARTKFNLRHAPLLLLEVLSRTASGTRILSDTMPEVIKRADELAEFLAIYWGKKKHPLSAQVKLGLAKAFNNFDAYQIAKYNRDHAIKLRDVMFLVHPKPERGKKKLFKQLAENELAAPDTWEVALSAGADKKETFERLLVENNLGYLALLRNMRNMENAGVSRDLVLNGLRQAKGFGRVFPFRFVAAARACPHWEKMIDEALQRKIEEMPSLPGSTVVLVDVSRSMDAPLSGKSDMNRIDAAASLASIIKSDNLRVFTFSHQLVEVPARRGMAGVDSVISSQPHGGTELAGALKVLNRDIKYDRIIVITDEQSHDGGIAPKGRGYMINVASNRNGVGYGPWTHIDGFSERVLDFMGEYERAE